MPSFINFVSNSYYKLTQQKDMNQDDHFTIDFIEQQHRDQVKMLMDILCIKLQQSYELFTMSGYNIQAAINMKTNPQPRNQAFNTSFSNSVPKNQQNNLNRSFGSPSQNDMDYSMLPQARRLPLRVAEESQFDVKFNKYLEFKQKKRNFAKNYKIRRQLNKSQPDSIASKIFKKQPKTQNSKKLLNRDPFIKKIQQGLFAKKCYIKFGRGSLSQSMESCFKYGLPLLIYHLAFDKKQSEIKPQQKGKKNKAKKNITKKLQIIDITQDDPVPKDKMNSNQNILDEKQTFTDSVKNFFLKNLLLSDRFLSMSNQAFINHIIDPETYQRETYFKQLIPNNKEQNPQSYLIVLRVNNRQQFQVVGKVDIDKYVSKLNLKTHTDQQITSQLLAQIKQLKNRCMQADQQQNRLRQRFFYFERNMQYSEKKPMTSSQKIKLNEDRQLIKQQQAEFLSLENVLREQKQNEINLQKQQKLSTLSKQEILQRRKQMRIKLQKEVKDMISKNSNTITIKLRLPSSKNLILEVSSGHQVQFLFDYISSHELESLGFQAQQENGCVERRFQIIRPQDRLNLTQVKSQLLTDVFADSQMETLVVKDIY